MIQYRVTFTAIYVLSSVRFCTLLDTHCCT